ncbi:hypothetical protein [Sphingomonas sp. NFX23]|uniref:hypothetical protein n=1 Tax=Sphingomonas sp. NFX23 TaxID=2819532 RepID=UPI003CEE9D5E
MNGTVSRTESATRELLDVLGKIAVVIPVAHVLACSLNLVGYTLAFQGNITSLLSFTDLFSLTFSGIGTTYIVGLLAPAIFLWVRHSAPPSPPIVVETEEEAVALRSKWRAKEARFDRLTYAMGMFMMAASVVLSISDRPVHPSIFICGALLSFMPEIWRGFERRGFKGQQISFVWLLLMFAAAAFGSGEVSGQIDRREAFAKIRVGRYGCNDLVVLRRVYEKYIAVRRDNRRLIIDDDCKTLFQFPVMKTFQYNPIIPNRLAFWRS